MPRISAEMLELAPQFTNTLHDREIDLRDQKISVIENLGGTLDQFDTIDFSNNDIRKLGGFPRLTRLRTIVLNGNRITRIQKNLQEAIPAIEELVLTRNLMVELGDLLPLQAFPKLERLSVMENPVSKLTNYRLFLIHILPKLRILDYTKIKDAEKKASKELFASPEGEAILEQAKQASAAPVPLELTQQNTAAGPSAEEVAKIKAAIMAAKSAEEIAALELKLKAGKFSS
eukprot:m.21380 g.21380  ORF g.21380 m.21380 type:complete len:231 (-) comp7131_c0_seq1:195-887(-)